MNKMETLDDVKEWARTVPGVEYREETPEVPFGAIECTMHKVTISIPTMFSTNVDESFIRSANEMREWVRDIQKSSPEYNILQSHSDMLEEVVGALWWALDHTEESALEERNFPGEYAAAWDKAFEIHTRAQALLKEATDDTD